MFEWLDQFKSGRDSITDKYAGRLVEFSTLLLKARMDDIILSHLIVTVEMNGEKVQVDRIHNIVSNKFKRHKMGIR